LDLRDRGKASDEIQGEHIRSNRALYARWRALASLFSSCGLWPPLFQRCGEKGGTAHCDYSELEVCFETDYAKGMAPPLLRTPFAKLKCASKTCLALAAFKRL